MTGLDWVLLAIVAVSALLGLMRGFVGVVLSLLSWLFAGVAAYHFGGDAAVMLSDDRTPSMGYLIGGYVLSFGGVMVFVMVLSWFVRRVLESVGLSGLDRGLGLAFGLLRGALFASVLVLLMGFTSLPTEPSWRRSAVVPVFEPGARWLRGLLPAGIARQVNFDVGGPISKQAWKEQEQALKPLIERNSAAAQNTGELLRSLGGQVQGQGQNPGQSLGGSAAQAMQDPSQLLRAFGDAAKAGRLPAPVPEAPEAPPQDPAKVDGTQAYDPAAVNGPASSRP